MIQGVTIGGLHCLDDLGMLLASKTISLPETQTTYIEIPGRDGSVDMTESLSGSIAYKDRKIQMTFVTNKNISKQEWPDFISNVANLIHGKRLQIIFDEDPDYYYEGRCEIDGFLTNSSKQEVDVTCTCDPYKYNIKNPTIKSL